jgi:hypothetical protein
MAVLLETAANTLGGRMSQNLLVFVLALGCY